MANKSLYVGNLSYNTTQEEMKQLFEEFGPVAEVRIVEGRGFGFVEIPEENAAAAILATNGKDVGGRTLTVNEARPKTEGSRGGSRGGGYGGGGGGYGGGGYGGGGGGGRSGGGFNNSGGKKPRW